ncbi:MAG: hypothetical protein QGH51_02765 [Planctomycetota bacterium]|jgi:hypothetical protein|nr:hypothetical protein [Planctomycetota bacterium]MDP6940925.1 hypothetical protein [Planctomycetota bacterium]
MVLRKPKKDYDPGFIPGSAAALCVAVVWVLVELGSGGASLEGEGELEQSNPVRHETPVDPSPARKPTVVSDLDDGNWQSDGRWAKAGKLGDAALETLQWAEKEHEEKGGINLAAYQKEAAVDIQKALSLLDGLAAEFPDNPVAQEQIRRRARKLEKRLGLTRK